MIVRTECISFRIHKLYSLLIVARFVIGILFTVNTQTDFALIDLLEMVKKLWPLLPSVGFAHVLIYATHDLVHLLLVHFL